MDLETENVRDIAVLSERLTNFDHKLDDVKASVERQSSTVANSVQEVLERYIDDHAALHTAHEKEHKSADSRFWAAFGIVATMLGGLIATLLVHFGIASLAWVTGTGTILLFSATAITAFVVVAHNKLAASFGSFLGYIYAKRNAKKP